MIQAGKLLSTLYTTYTLDVTEVKRIMNNPEQFEKVMERKPKLTDMTDIESTGYIDDISHVVASKDKDTLEIMINANIRFWSG